MQPRCCFAFTLLCSLSLLSSVLSIQCNETQYQWPVLNPKYCCNKCPPGTYVLMRSDLCQIQCKPCVGERFRDTYTEAQTCKFCDSCNGANSEFKSRCNATHDAVCRCRTGYECKDQSCKDCVPIQSTTKPTLPPSTTDTVWFLVIIALLLVGIAVIVLTKIKPFLRWITSKYGCLLDETCAPVPSSEDTEVSKPVQDTCGKCDQPLV
ncbi:tumor necrosis factor receptor superfamily member 4 [Symphorus nematophorus]